MQHYIDVKELFIRESERVEWKENGWDKDIVVGIVKTAAAFANDLANLGGGYIVCGVKEIKDEYGFPKIEFTGLSANRLMEEVEGKVLQACREYVSPTIAPMVFVEDNPNDVSTKILIFLVLASTHAHTFRDGLTSKYYVRIGRETREARNGVLAQLLIKKQELDFFDRRIAPRASLSDLDGLLLRECLVEIGLYDERVPIDYYYSDNNQIADLIPPLCGKNNLTGQLQPKNFALLMFGRKRAITSIFTEAHIVVSFYPGINRASDTSKKHYLTGDIVQQVKMALSLLQSEDYIVIDKLKERPNHNRYPFRTIKEAVVNAVVHRDYALPEPIRITVFSNRIEVLSPGGVHWGVDKARLLRGESSPKWRNQSLAYLFNKMQLSQSEGQGIPTIFRTMREEGCPEPVLEFGEDSFCCILFAHLG